MFLLSLAIRIVQSEYIHSGKVAMKRNGSWEILRVKHWDKELGHLACASIGFPGLVKNFKLPEYRGRKGYNNFDCQNRKNKLVCCPSKIFHDFPSIPEVAVMCEPGKLIKLHLTGCSQSLI